MVGGGTRANRPEVAMALRALIEKTQIPFVATMMGKGVAEERGPLYVGTSIMPGDYPNCAVQAADVILNVGHDVMEKPTFHMRPDDGRTVIHLNPFPAQGDTVYFPQHQLVGDMAAALEGLAAALAPNPDWDHGPDAARRGSHAGEHRPRGHRFERTREAGLRGAPAARIHGREDILSLDNGIHMLWITRNYGAYQPNTMLIDHALGSMGIGLPGGHCRETGAPGAQGGRGHR